MNDSIWAVVAGTAKAYNLAPEYVLYDMSYVNTLMFGSVLPTYDPERHKKDAARKPAKVQDVLKVDDPHNRDKVRKFLDSIQ